jgi:hypothetical protein
MSTKGWNVLNRSSSDRQAVGEVNSDMVEAVVAQSQAERQIGF